MQGSSEAPVGLSGKQLDLFWSAVVGDNVFESTAERKFMCFQLFARLLPHIRYTVPHLKLPACTSVRKCIMISPSGSIQHCSA